MIYNGCRSHYIRRMKVNSMQSMTPLEPPHYDSISGLSWIGEHLISASKDRVIKVWDVGKKEKKPLLVNQVFNANKDYIRILKGNQAENLVFSADDAGEIKFWDLKGTKLECHGGLAPSPSPILAADWIQSVPDGLICSTADKLLNVYKVSNPASDLKLA